MNREEALKILRSSEEIVSGAEVDASIGRMAAAIHTDMADDFPLVLSVMGGATVFTGMLLPRLDFPLEFDHVHLTRYGTRAPDATTPWRVSPGNVKDRVVLVLDDILDDGNTMAAIRDRVLAMGARRFTCAVLCEKNMARTKPLKPDFCGSQVPDRHVFGCGMDIDGYWRNLPAIYAAQVNR